MAEAKYVLSRRAVADLEKISEHLASRSLTAADRVIDTLHVTFQALAKNPEIGTKRDDLHPDVRLFTPLRPARSYVIFYYPAAEGIIVSDVIHSARDWVGMFARQER